MRTQYTTKLTGNGFLELAAKMRSSREPHHNARNARALTILAAVLLLFVFDATATVRYVDLNSPNATRPYTNWTTAATVIQDAVEAAAARDEIVVTNGIYVIGGRALSGTGTSRVEVNKPLTLRSVNNPQFTVINGLGRGRC